MKCQTCKSERILTFSAKCSDLFFCSIGDKEHDGYVPDDFVLGKGQFGDYCAGALCLDCGQIQGKWPNKKMELEKRMEMSR